MPKQSFVRECRMEGIRDMLHTCGGVNKDMRGLLRAANELYETWERGPGGLQSSEIECGARAKPEQKLDDVIGQSVVRTVWLQPMDPSVRALRPRIPRPRRV